MLDNIAQKGASQEAQQLASQGMNTFLKDVIESKDKKDKIADKTGKSDDMLSTLVDSGNDKGARLSFLKGHLTKMASAGVTIQQAKLAPNKKENMEDGEEVLGKDSSRDTAMITKAAAKNASKNALLPAFQNFRLPAGLNGEQQKAAEIYVSAFFDFLVKDDPKVKQKKSTAEEMMRKSGISEEKIATISKEIRTAVRADISLRLKESLLFRDLSESNIDSHMFQFSSDDILNEAFSNIKLGGRSFGGYNTHLEGTANKVMQENVKELEMFAKEQFEAKMIETMVKGKQGIDPELQKLIDLCVKNGIDVGSWIQDVWDKRKSDLGLVKIDLPAPNTGQMVNTNSDNPSKERRDTWEDLVAVDEKGSLVDQLRAVYMQRFIKGDPVTYLRTLFKVRKIKNGLMKVGIYTKDLDEKVSFEAETIARKKVLEMLNEAVMERATLYKMKGGSFKANSNTINTLVESAERLGVGVSKEELAEMQFKANNIMLQIVSDQIREVEAITRTRKSKAADKMLSKLSTLKARLEAEISGNTAPGTFDPESLKSELA